MSEKIYTLNEIKEIIFPIAVQHGVERVYLFGSYARGEATPQSDLDFRIDKGAIKGLIALGGLYNDLSANFDKDLDLLTTGSLDEDFLRGISDEEILVYERI